MEIGHNQIMHFRVVRWFAFATVLNCAVTENTHTSPPPSPTQKGLEFPGGWGYCETKKFKDMYETYLKFSQAWQGGS